MTPPPGLASEVLPDPAPPLEGAPSARVGVVTGVTQGIGRATTLGLLRQGFHLAVVVRGASRGRETAKALMEEAGHPSARAHAFDADLTLGSEVERAARQILERHPRIHLLLNNAGVADRSYQTTPEGLERTLAVNHLAPVRLVHHLLPALLAAGEDGEARIVNVSSNAHARTLDLTAFEGPRGYAGLHAYRQSKLLNLIHAFDLARRLQGTGVTVNALHPGLIGTGLLYDFLPAGIIRTVFRPLLSILAKSPEEGARTPLHVASAPGLAGVTGRYFVKEAEAEPAPVSREREVQDGVRRWTEGLIGVDWRRFPLPEPG